MTPPEPEPTFAVPFRELMDIETRDGQIIWWCGLPQDCAAANVPAESHEAAVYDAMVHLAREHNIRRVSITDCIDVDDPVMKDRASRICGDVTGPHGAGGECVQLAGHPHEDGIGGEWEVSDDRT